MRSFLLALATFLPAAAAAQDLVAKTDALSPADEAKKFKLPPGFTAQLVASEPDIQKPMQVAFDARGRLWVTTSHHYPWAAEGGKGTDKLFVLSDFDATGKARTVEVFDDQLNIPIGVLPLPDGKSVIVSECGKILKLTDTDGNMKADKREVLFEGFGFKDTHGMTNSFTLLPDGWVYACHGFANDSRVKGKDGHEVVMNSGHTFRFRPDGSRIEVFTRGQVNPFGIAVDPWLNLYTADCHSKPVTQLIRGAHYDSFGKPHDGLGYAPHVYQHLHNSTGLCGLAYYAADHFPKEWTGVMFLGNVVTSRINVDRIEWKGSTPVGKELDDFLVSDDPWFRPVDIKLGPDGALYVADFYNKIIGHYEVDLRHPGRDKDRGRVWRIVWTGTDPRALVPPPKMPYTDLTTQPLDGLVNVALRPNMTAKLAATIALQTRREEFQKQGLQRERVYAQMMSNRRFDPLVVWGVTGETMATLPVRHDPGLKEEVSRLFEDPVFVRWVNATRPADADTRRYLISVLETKPPPMQRAAVDGMTARPHPDFVEPLLDRLPKVPAADTHLRHAGLIALRNSLEAVGGEKWLVGTVTAASDAEDFTTLVAALLGSADARAADRLAHLLRKGMIEDDRAFEVGRRVGRHGTPAEWDALADALDAPKRKPGAYWLRALAGVFRGLQEKGYKPGPNDERYGFFAAAALQLGREALLGPAADLRGPAVELYQEVRRVGPAALTRRHPEPIPTDVLRDERLPLDQRALAAEVVALFDLPAARGTLHKLIAEETTAAADRARLISVLLGNRPSVTDCGVAKDAIKTAPYAQAVSIAVGLAADPFGADLLLAAVKSGDAPARLLQERAVIDRLKVTKVPDLDAKLKELTKTLPPAEKRLDELIKARAAGFPKAAADVAQGKAVFTKHCAVCHQLNGEGAKVGPQLDGVGIRGLERLLEDTLDPNRNVDHAFRATKLDLKDGRTATGLLLREEGEVYVLADTLGKEQRVSKADVDGKTTGNTSAMPANLDTVMTEAEYYHLLRFLLEQKAKK